jgi:hypothetical protein
MKGDIREQKTPNIQHRTPNDPGRGQEPSATDFFLISWFESPAIASHPLQPNSFMICEWS